MPTAVSEVSTLLGPNRSLEAHNSFKKSAWFGVWSAGNWSATFGYSQLSDA